MKSTEIEPDVNQLSEVLTSYGRPVVLVPIGSMRFGHTVPWEVKIQLYFDDQPDATILTPLDYRIHVIKRIDVMIQELRKLGWVPNDSIDIELGINYTVPALAGSMEKPRLGRAPKEMFTTSNIKFSLIPIWGEIDGA